MERWGEQTRASNFSKLFHGNYQGHRDIKFDEPLHSERLLHIPIFLLFHGLPIILLNYTQINAYLLAFVHRTYAFIIAYSFLISASLWPRLTLVSKDFRNKRNDIHRRHYWVDNWDASVSNVSASSRARRLRSSAKDRIPYECRHDMCATRLLRSWSRLK